jgi:ABC-2 type transport system permease protein
VSTRAALPEAGRVRSVVDYYLTTMRTSIINQFQYRVAQYFYMLGMVAEPIVYLVVWTTIANESGGEINGFTTGELAAYYIVWTLVRNIVFFVAIWGAYLLRTMLQSTLGMLCFWTTRGAAIFDLYMTTELLLSGRLVPLPLMPDWVQTLAAFLPFQWAFFFPIDALVGDRSTASLLGGLAMQLFWILVAFGLFKLAWRGAIKRFSAVGG